MSAEAPRLRGFAEAAAYLQCSERWLRRNSSRYAREKRGREVLFSEAQLELIREDTTIRPPIAAETPLGDLANLRPLPRRCAA
ncbi:hypothetical protein ACU686_44445 [Yinghuangia aomiensis]